MVETLKLEKGKITMCDVPFVFTFTKSIYYMQKELEKVAGPAWKKICYDCGKADVMVCISNYIAIFRKDQQVKKIFSDNFEAFKFCVAELNRMGKGKLEIVVADKERPFFILRLHFSGIALAYLEHEKSREPMCYHFAGIWGGGTNLMYPGVEAVETKCIAKGDPYCEFVIEISKKK